MGRSVDPSIYEPLSRYFERSSSRQGLRARLIGEISGLLASQEMTLEDFRRALEILAEVLALDNSAELDHDHTLQVILYQVESERG